MEENRTACLRFTLMEEGGYVNDPRDPGGATKFGITLPTLRRWQGNPSLGASDIFNLSAETASAIYTDDFWTAAWADGLAAGIDLMVFDFAVNAGCCRSIKSVQTAVELTGKQLDGRIGPRTLDAVAKIEPLELVSRLSLAQRRYYRMLPGYRVFGRGWIARTDRRERTSRAMLHEICHPPDASEAVGESDASIQVRTDQS